MAARFSGFDVDLKLRGSVVMIVGATAGIGAATARLLVEEGARLMAPSLDARFHE